MLESMLHLLFLLSFLHCIFFLTITSTTITNHVAVHRCRPDQTETLTRFRNEFAFSSSCSDDASFFGGVICDNATGAVTVLDLPAGCLRGTLRPNSSLFELRHLRRLTLTGNNFALSSLSSTFGQLTNLEFLFLSSNGFIGQVPSSIGNLTKLTELDLSDNKLSGNLFPHLRNLTKLSALSLRHNQFSGTIPSYFFTMPSLYFLDLRSNHLIGSFEVLKNSSSRLETLRLGYNNFKAEIIDPVLKLVNLRALTLSYLNISQPIDLTLFFSLKSLSHLNLNGNSLTRMSVNSDTDLPKKMKFLLLAGCNISEFPRFFKSLEMLNYLVLSDNRIKGNVPDWLWSLPRLKTLVLSNNYFTGFQGSLDHVLVNSSLEILDLSSNSFRGSFPTLPLHILTFSAFNNSFAGNIPLEICNRTSLEILDLSYNNLTGSIPPCLSYFTTVNLRKNNLEGKIPDEFYIGAWTETLDVGYNRLSGKLPRSLLNCSFLKLLIVDHNGINDSFPFWLTSLPNLKVLTIRSNMFHGLISPADDQGPLAFPELRILEISHNRFTGSLPANYFANWSAASLKENDEESLYMGDSREFPFTYHNTLDLQYKGLNMEQVKVLTSLTAIDFSGNKFEGEIPESVGLLNTLIALNLSNNSFTGHIPMSFANLTHLESLDLSGNKLSGKIPQELRRLSSLAYIDVSDNQLTGEIPQGPQIMGQPKSSFEGNPGLCGLPLKESCISKNTPSTLVPEKEDEEEILKWRAVAIGYGPGVLFGLAIGHVVALYKPKWFIKNYGQYRFRGIRQL